MAEARPRVLVVDDKEPARYARAHRLREAGYDVTEAASGSDALATVAEDTVDLVVLDVHLPDLHGFEVCRAIKESPGTAHIPVLEVSSVFVSREDRVAGLRSGAEWYLVEPVDDEELVATCRILVRAGQAERKLRRALADAIAGAQLEMELRARARQHADVASTPLPAHSTWSTPASSNCCRAATPCSCEPGWDGRRAWWARPRWGRGWNPRPATPSPRIRP
jgi:DNA-binding response OmpR family regulator